MRFTSRVHDEEEAPSDTKEGEKLPRVSIERRHKHPITGKLQYMGLNPRANLILDEVVADTYLSLE